MVYDERGNFVGDTHWREDFPLGDGEELQLERGGTIVQVNECIGSRDQDLSELVDKRAQEKARRQSAALARRHPTLEPTTPQPAVGSAAAPHVQLRHRPLHHLIGTPTGHHGRALIPKESPFEQRQLKQQLQLEASLVQDDTDRPAKRRKRDISPPSKSGYAQSLFGATLTLSGRPMSSAPIRRRPVNTILARQGDAYPASSDRSNRDSDMGLTSLASRETATPTLPHVVSAGDHLLTNASPSRPASPPRRSAQSHQASSPIPIEESPEKQRISNAAYNHASKSLSLTENNRESDRKRRNPLQPVSFNENQAIACLANQERNGNVPKQRLPDLEITSKVARRREGRREPSEAEQSEIHGEAHMISHRAQVPLDTASSSRSSKKSSVNEIARGSGVEVPAEEPRTELRIRTRKRPGLLLLSEKIPVTKSNLRKMRVSDNSTCEAPGEISSNKFRSERKASKDTRSRSSPDRGKRQGSRSRQHETTRREPVLTEEVMLFDDDSPEAPEKGSPVQTSLTKGPKPRDSALIARGREGTTTRLSSPHCSDNENVTAASNGDLFEEMGRSGSQGAQREKDVRVMTSDMEDGAQLESSRTPELRTQRSRRTKERDAACMNTESKESSVDRPEIWDEEESDLPEEVPAPRLARIKRNIRSKELIGFRFDEDNEEDDKDTNASANNRPDASRQQQDPRAQPSSITSSTVEPRNSEAIEVPPVMVRRSYNQDDILRDLSDGTNSVKLLGKNNECLGSCQEDQIPVYGVTTTNNPRRDIQGYEDISLGKPQLLLDSPQSLERHAMGPHLDSGVQQIVLPNGVSVEFQPRLISNRPQQEDNPAPGTSNVGEIAGKVTLEDTEAALPGTLTARKIINPATRGKKAAKPSDAAGQPPQCPLPAEVKNAGPPRLLNAKKLGEAGNQDKGGNTPLPGFTRANGGPWSREAFDLFEFKRPT